MLDMSMTLSVLKLFRLNRFIDWQFSNKWEAFNSWFVSISLIITFDNEVHL